MFAVVFSFFEGLKISLKNKQDCHSYWTTLTLSLASQRKAGELFVPEVGISENPFLTLHYTLPFSLESLESEFAEDV